MSSARGGTTTKATSYCDSIDDNGALYGGGFKVLKLIVENGGGREMRSIWARDGGSAWHHLKAINMV